MVKLTRLRAESKALMSKAKLGKIPNDKTREALSIARGQSVYLYKLNSFKPLSLTPPATTVALLCGAEQRVVDRLIGEGIETFVYIKNFNSIREAGQATPGYARLRQATPGWEIF
jgi:hypothetical protein